MDILSILIYISIGFALCMPFKINNNNEKFEKIYNKIEILNNATCGFDSREIWNEFGYLLDEIDLLKDIYKNNYLN